MIELIHDDNELVILHFKDLAIRLVDQYAYFQGEMNLKNINKNMYCKSDNNIINFTYDVHIGVESLGKILKRLTPLLRLPMYLFIIVCDSFMRSITNSGVAFPMDSP